ncbi:uncharacterized protein LOC110319832 [Mus pahari]|uniref:uncharacterized protein LOC110319832 n=1 Tax=Mus pahari TaxID=10093 RepID=UPI000A313719|nr:uncharacterized protein LOC110319832 [Mus pahari]
MECRSPDGAGGTCLAGRRGLLVARLRPTGTLVRGPLVPEPRAAQSWLPLPDPAALVWSATSAHGSPPGWMPQFPRPATLGVRGGVHAEKTLHRSRCSLRILGDQGDLGLESGRSPKTGKLLLPKP